MLAAGTVLGKYKLLRLLGRGGMADVYEAEDQMLGRHVALKVLPPEFGRDTTAVARFEKEVRAAAVLNHSGIVTVYDVAQADGVHFYAMRLLGGGDLRNRIDHGLTDIEALTILRALADAFSHAHAAGFVHRDVKPENILFDEQGRAVLTDFGIAKAISSSSKMTATGVSIGTPRYISPEQARGKPVDARADLYSLGVILFEMLTGKLPFEAEDSLALIFKHVTEPVPPLPESLQRYQPLIDTLMAKEVDQRPASAAELVAMINPLLPAQRSITLPRIPTTASTPSHPTIVTGEREYAKQLVSEEERQRQNELERRKADTLISAPTPPPVTPAAAAPTVTTAAPTAPVSAPTPPASSPRPARRSVLAASAETASPPATSAQKRPPLAVFAAAGVVVLLLVLWWVWPSSTEETTRAEGQPVELAQATPDGTIVEPIATTATEEAVVADEEVLEPEPTEEELLAAEEARLKAEQEAAKRKADAERRRREQERQRREAAAAAAAATPTPVVDEATRRAQQLAREKSQCARHVSDLFPGWTFLYADIVAYEGVTKLDNGFIETPPLAMDYGPLQRYVIDNKGCIVESRR